MAAIEARAVRTGSTTSGVADGGDITTAAKPKGQRQVFADDKGFVPRETRSGNKRARDEGIDDDVLAPIQKKLRRIAQQSDHVLLKLYQLQHEEQTLASCGNFVELSAEEFVRTIPAVLEGVENDSHRSELESSRSRLEADIAIFKEKSSSVQGFRNEVTQGESRLKGRIERLAKLLRNTPLTLHLRNMEELRATQSNTESNTSSAHSSSESNTPTILAQYFDKKGDIGILQERLGELEYSFQEALLQRDLVQDRGEEVDVSDEKYYENHLRERRGILDDLERAERETFELAQKCRELGLEITGHIRNASSTGASENADASPRGLFSRPAASLPIIQRRGYGNRPLHLDHQAQSRVQNWLSSVLQSGPSPTSLANGETALERAPTADSDRKDRGSPIWRSIRIEGVVMAAEMLQISPSTPWDSSKLDFGLSMRRVHTDPGYLPQCSNDGVRMSEPHSRTPARPSGEKAPEGQQMFQSAGIKDQEKDHDSNVATQKSEAQGKGSSWGWLARFGRWR